jgi:threonine/homoserine/homoserine lactone efflux protein
VAPLGGGEQPARAERPVKLFLGSLALTMGNPKTMVFFLAVLPTVAVMAGAAVAVATR